MKLKPYIRYLIAACFVVFVLIVISQIPSIPSMESTEIAEESHLQDERTIHRIELPDVEKVDSIQEVKDFYYKFTPGLKRAEEAGLTREIDQVFQFPDTSFEITVDEVWYNETGGYIFYHANIPEVDQVMFRLGPAGIEGIHDYTTFPKNLFQNNRGVEYENKFYSREAFQYFRDKEFNMIERLENLLVIDVTMRTSEEEYYLLNVNSPIKINYDINNEIVNRYPINKMIQVQGHQLSLDYIDLGTAQNTLVYRFESSDPKIHFSRIIGEIESDSEKYPLGFGETRIENDKISFRFPPFNEVPHNIDISIQHIELFGEDSLSFEIDLDEYSDEITESKEITKTTEQSINESLGVFHNTEVFLEKLVFSNGSVGVGLFYDKPVGLKEPFEQLVDGIGFWGDSRLDPNLKNVSANFLDIHNEKNEHISEFGDFGGSFGGPESHFGFDLSQNFVNNAKQVKIDIHNLLFEIVGKWDVSVPIPE